MRIVNKRYTKQINKSIINDNRVLQINALKKHLLTLEDKMEVAHSINDIKQVVTINKNITNVKKKINSLSLNQVKRR